MKAVNARDHPRALNDKASGLSLGQKMGIFSFVSCMVDVQILIDLVFFLESHISKMLHIYIYM